MICFNCRENKKNYDFVLPDQDDKSQICRKCHHKNQGINDEDYESFIEIHKKCNRLKESTIVLIESVEEDIKNDNIEKYTEVSADVFLGYLYLYMENYDEIIRCNERKMKNIESWSKLVMKYKI